MTSLVEVTRFTPQGDLTWELHDHDTHQLAWTPGGLLSIAAEGHDYLVPPTLALWVPAGVLHATAMARRAVTYFLYFEPARCPLRWTSPTAVTVDGLAAELIAYLDGAAHDDGLRQAAEDLLLGSLEPVADRAIEIPLPSDPRAREVALGLLADPADPRDLTAWAEAVGTSVRTLARGFADGTGMSFGHWRTQARLRNAMVRLGDGEPVAAVARAVGYRSTSAFVATFRRFTGRTPGAAAR